jgi:hypothetical protein
MSFSLISSSLALCANKPRKLAERHAAALRLSASAVARDSLRPKPEGRGVLSQRGSHDWIGVAAANRCLRLGSNFHAQLTLPMSLRSEMGGGKHWDCKAGCWRGSIDVDAQSRTLRYGYRGPVGHDKLGGNWLLSASRGYVRLPGCWAGALRCRAGANLHWPRSLFAPAD